MQNKMEWPEIAIKVPVVWKYIEEDKFFASSAWFS